MLPSARLEEQIESSFVCMPARSIPLLVISTPKLACSSEPRARGWTSLGYRLVVEELICGVAGMVSVYQHYHLIETPPLSVFTKCILRNECVIHLTKSNIQSGRQRYACRSSFSLEEDQFIIQFIHGFLEIRLCFPEPLLLLL